MDLLAQLLTAPDLRASYAPDADFWYGPVGGTMTIAGLRLDAEGAKKISAWFCGRDILATSLAMLPLNLLQRLPDDQGAEPARSHVLYDTLHRKPNASDDSFTWRRHAMFDLIDYGHAYNWITIGSSWALDRIDPQLVTTERIKTGTNKGRTLYHVRDEATGRTAVHTQDEIFHLRGADGKGILESARDSLGLSAVTEQYAGKIYSKGMLNGGTIEVPGPMDTESGRAMAQSFVTAAGEWHMPRILPMGAKMAAGEQLTPEKAQMLLSRKFSVNEIARWLRLPPHMIGDLDRATFSNIEEQGQEFVTYSLGHWLSLWEFAINDQLILQPNRFYAEFVRDALVRGDIAKRWQAYTQAVQTGTFTRNEVRRKENMRALDGLDEPLDPAHLTGSQAGGSQNEPRQPARPPSTSRAEAIVTESAARVQRKEIAAAHKAAIKHAADAAAFEQWATAFYAEHVPFVMATMCLDEINARFYCESQRDEVIAGGLAATEQWSPDWLVGLALDLPRPDPMFVIAKAAVEKPDPPIQVNAGIEQGAIAVSTPVDAKTSVAPAAITVHGAPIDARVTFEEGAIQHATTIEAQEPAEMEVTKTVTRGEKGIEEVREVHKPRKVRRRGADS